MFLILTLAATSPARATDLTFGSVVALPGGPAHVPVLVSNAAPGISAFAIWFTNAPGFPLPAVTAGPDQTNLTVFVDPQTNGLLRLTGLILDGPPVSNGHVATLEYTVPAELDPGAYPVMVAGVLSTNPEVRALITNELLPASGTGGFIYVPGAIQLTSLVGGGGTFQFAFAGTNVFSYTVLASTNLTDWSVLGPAMEISPDHFEFSDPDADLHSHRFYRVRVP